MANTKTLWSTIKWAGIGLGPLIYFSALAWEGVQMKDVLFGLPIWAWHIIAGAIFFAAVVGLLIGYRRELDERAAISPHSEIGHKILGKHSTVEFFTSREELDRRYSPSEIFKEGNEIHAYFLSGAGIFASHSSYMRYVKRLILPNPEAQSLDTLGKFSNSYANSSRQITETAAIAQTCHVQVRLFQDFIGASLLICNPERSDAWIHIGLILPCTESAERQHYRLEKSSHPDAFHAIYETFKEMWRVSHEVYAEINISTTRLFVGRITVSVSQLADKHYIDLTFNVFNGSGATLKIDRTPKGFILLDDVPLPIRPSIENVHGSGREFMIELRQYFQPVQANEVNGLINAGETIKLMLYDLQIHGRFDHGSTIQIPLPDGLSVSNGIHVGYVHALSTGGNLGTGGNVG